MIRSQFLVSGRGVYKISCTKLPDRFYIGSSHNVFVRWQQHVTAWVCYKNPVNVKLTNIRLLTDVLRFGPQVFTFEILELCPLATETQLREIEMKYIKKLQPFYNIIK